MEIAQAFDIFPLNDAHFPPFLGKNEEDETMLLLDAAFAEELQFQEALKASLITCQMPTSGTSAKPSVHVEVRGESSMGFCENCLGKKENDQLIKNGNCRHPICLECISKHVEAKIKLGMKTFTCPGLNCECVLQLETFKNVLSKDVLNLWEKALSTKLVPKRTCRKGLYAKTGSENGNGKHFTAGTSKILSTRDTDHGSDSDTLPDTDDYDSEASPRSPENCKKSKLFRNFLRDWNI
ncbi:hypothetical protein GH714_032835 [Hevea brasiliensis]|uniref:RING-type domain-containing protein n=1 Tax=Hevea brasiliensis TaxID=3981 RepID=A0A6A6NDZ3_HEVBR|nr:hypothetical protein GH714_032835 [Hevea brasiliensis]